MAITFPTPPTYALPIEKDPTTGRETFSPIWLQWFLDAARYLSSVGTGGSSIDHNTLQNLQGGASSEKYHLSSANNTALSGARITKGALTTDDLIVDNAAKGLVLKDTQATPHYWRVTVTVLGALVTTDLGASPP